MHGTLRSLGFSDYLIKLATHLNKGPYQNVQKMLDDVVKLESSDLSAVKGATSNGATESDRDMDGKNQRTSTLFVMRSIEACPC